MIKKIFLVLFFVLIFLGSKMIVNAADDCEKLNPEDVRFKPTQQVLEGRSIVLYIDTKNCKESELYVELWGYASTEDNLNLSIEDIVDLDNTDKENKDRVIIQPISDTVKIYYVGDENGCATKNSNLKNALFYGYGDLDLRDYLECKIYVKIFKKEQDNSLLEIYNSRKQITEFLNAWKAVKERTDTEAVEKQNIVNSFNFKNGVLLGACDGTCGISDWEFKQVVGAREIGEDGGVINDPEAVNAKQYIDFDSPCFKNDAYNESCYEFLAPIPGFVSEYPDPNNPDEKLSNITEKGGRFAISDLRKFQFGDMVNSLFQISLGILMVLAVIMIVVAGVEYMTTESLYGKGQARQRITGALTGLILSLGIFLILKTINPKLLEVNFGKDIETVNIKIQSQTTLSDADYKILTGKRAPLPSEILAATIAAAQKEKIDYCAIDAILKKETANYNALAIGHDENVTKPQTRSNKALIASGKTYYGSTPISKNDVPKNKIDWRFSVGIGLMQVTLFPEGYFTDNYIKTIDSKWGLRDTPNTRTIEGTTYTWKQLLDPETNIRAGIKILKSGNSNDPKTAYTKYNGGSEYGRTAALLYQGCCRDNANDPIKKCKNFLQN